MAFTKTGNALDSRGPFPNWSKSNDSAGKFDNIWLTERGGTVHLEVMDAANSPVFEARVCLLADPAGYAPAGRGSLLHGRVYHQDATASGVGSVRLARVPGGKMRVGLDDIRGKLHTSEATVAEGRHLRLAIRLP